MQNVHFSILSQVPLRIFFQPEVVGEILLSILNNVWKKCLNGFWEKEIENCFRSFKNFVRVG